MLQNLDKQTDKCSLQSANKTDKCSATIENQILIFINLLK